MTTASRYLLTLAMTLPFGGVLLAFYNVREPDAYLTLYVVEYLIVLVVFAHLQAQTRRAATRVGLALVGSFAILTGLRLGAALGLGPGLPRVGTAAPAVLTAAPPIVLPPIPRAAAQTTLVWSVPERVFPWHPFEVSGQVLTEGATPALARRLALLLDGRPLTEVVVHGRFRVQVSVPPDFGSGTHVLTAIVRAQAQYGEAVDRRLIGMAAAPMLLRVRVDGVVWLPGTVALSGVARSAAGPSVETGVVQIRLGDATASVRPGPGGSFAVTMPLPFTLRLVGPQRLEARVRPESQWSLPAATSSPVFVVNLLNLALAAAAVMPFATAAVAARRRRRRAETHALSVSDPARRGVPHEYGGDRMEDAATLRDRLLAFYRMAADFVEARTRVPFRVQFTLREFAKAVAPVLRGEAFDRMTGLAETALYAPRPVTDDMLVSMQHHWTELNSESADGQS